MKIAIEAVLTNSEARDTATVNHVVAQAAEAYAPWLNEDAAN